MSEEITGVEQILRSVSIDVDQIRKAVARIERSNGPLDVPEELASAVHANLHLVYSALGSIERAIDGLSLEIEGASGE